MSKVKGHIFIGADHRGVDLRAYLLDKINGYGVGFSDLGGDDPDAEDDYTDVSLKVARSVQSNPGSFGILICGSGAGVDIVANKVFGIRSALVFDETRAKQAREHENANIISLPADVLEKEEAWNIVKTFIDTPFSNEKRHLRRLKKMQWIEKFGHLPIIVPAILATTPEDYQNQMDKLDKVKGVFEWVQIDFMDNIFVHNKSIPPEVIEKFHRRNEGKEAHLMVMYPMEWIKDVIKTGIDRIIFPVESEDNLLDVLDYIKNYADHLQVGLALNPETPVSEVEAFLDKIDLLLLMSVEPGKQGQQFMPGVIEKVKEASKLRSKSRPFIIAVDGGITTEVAKDLVEAGVNNLVVGSHLLEGDIGKNMEDFYKAIYG